MKIYLRFSNVFVRFCALVLKFFGHFFLTSTVLFLCYCYVIFFADSLLWMSIVICIVYLLYCLFVLSLHNTKAWMLCLSVCDMLSELHLFRWVPFWKCGTHVLFVGNPVVLMHVYFSCSLICWLICCCCHEKWSQSVVKIVKIFSNEPVINYG